MVGGSSPPVGTIRCWLSGTAPACQVGNGEFDSRTPDHAHGASGRRHFPVEEALVGSSPIVRAMAHSASGRPGGSQPPNRSSILLCATLRMWRNQVRRDRLRLCWTLVRMHVRIVSSALSGRGSAEERCVRDAEVASSILADQTIGERRLSVGRARL